TGLNILNNGGFVLWLTGLPGAGKTTLAMGVRDEIRKIGGRVEVLDGDEIRRGLSRDLGFSKEDREKHNERVIYVAKLLSRNGVATLVPLISPYREIRVRARSEINNFIEVYVRCPLDVLIKRDPKGLYRKALAGEINNLTGIQDPYEEPQAPEIIIDTDKLSVEESVKKIMDYLYSRGFLDGLRKLE
ncbi:MAG: adenylyl-sulfate kinase, partial [Thermoplasmatales archaeon]